MANENHTTGHRREWAGVALLLVFAAVLIATGVTERDINLIAGALAIALVVLGGLALYVRVTGWR